ncbi:MAG TPA: DUF4956 domain-containing protein [Polyangiaceae bacterium]|nr:DUF4956 domain-containing protein [Polyangiaceae bacterium]
MDELLKDLERTGHLTSSISFFDVTAALCLSFALSLVIAWIYRATHHGVSYSQQYVHTLVLMGTVVALIMLIIGSNVARAFALVGALSIIRFRNAMKETRDVGFIFLVMALGMAVGTRFYLLAIYATAMLSAFLVALTRFNMFAKDVTERILRVQFPVDRDYERAFEVPFRAHLEQHRVISVETVRAGVLQEVVLSVVLKRSSSPSALLEAVRACNDNNKVSLIIGQQAVDL